MLTAILKFDSLPFGVDELDVKIVPWYYTPTMNDHYLNSLNCLNIPYAGRYKDPLNMLHELRHATMLEV
jgi:hypothetical protein